MVRGLGGSLTDLNLSSSLTSLEGVLALAEGMPRLRRLDLSECIPGGGLGACVVYMMVVVVVMMVE